jgi:hypothetical protein
MRQRKQQDCGTGERGGVLVVGVLMLAIAGVTAGSMLTAQLSYTRTCDAAYSVDKALYLADAGLRAALVKLNEDGEANISTNASRGYFSISNVFSAADWSFETTLVVTNGRYVIMSSGRYAGKRVDVQGEASLGSGNRSLHALYAHALFAGDSSGDTNYVLLIGGTNTSADYVNGDTYSGNRIVRSGTAMLRLPEVFADGNTNAVCDPEETWTDALTLGKYTNALTSAQFTILTNAMRTNMSRVYNNGKYDVGEAYVDTIGNGQYDVGEPFTDSNANGVRDTGDGFIDRNGNGVYDVGETVVDRGNGRYDTGEEWVEDAVHKISNKKVRVNGRWDRKGGYWKDGTTWTSNSTTRLWAAESYEDVGDGVYQAEEAYIDQNGIYDAGEKYLDDRNGIYDYGTQAKGAITGMPAPGIGQRPATGRDAAIDPPDLLHMYYDVSRTAEQPAGALTRWGNDVAVTASDYGSARAITDLSRPEHIFVRNPPTSGSVSSGGKTIYGRSYSYVYATNGTRIDDYFLEDPADSTYNSSVSADSIDGTTYTAPMYLNVQPTANVKLYYVNGNVYIHHPQVYSLRFRQPGTRITIVASGNITISDEFYYNADYDAGLTRADVNSSIVNNPSDALCLIALKNPTCTNSGNIYIGDSQFGTGGSIHAMLYAENDFIDNNINSSDQAFISIFGNMTAGDQVRINRQEVGATYRTRLDVTLDERIRDGTIVVPGLPHPVGSQRRINVTTAWQLVPGTWSSWSMLQ